MPHSLLPVIDARRAYRAISDQPIERKVLETLAKAAHWAPSCANNQPWRLVIVDEPEPLSVVKDAFTGGNYWAKQSPAIVLFASHIDLDCTVPDGREYFLFGCGMAAMNLMLQATEMGLIAHPIAGYRSSPIKEALGIPQDHTLIALVVLGYPSKDTRKLTDKHQAEETSPRVRRPLQELLFWNAWPDQASHD
ncbi:MAG TPA: nitroreductase [Candidatus Acetothermia bacterium]|nr:nitroreductase [Candidatus Acetothermia bacterium]